MERGCVLEFLPIDGDDPVLQRGDASTSTQWPAGKTREELASFRSVREGDEGVEDGRREDLSKEAQVSEQTSSSQRS